MIKSEMLLRPVGPDAICHSTKNYEIDKGSFSYVSLFVRFL